MIDDDDDEEEELFVRPSRTAKKPTSKAASARSKPPVKRAPARSAATKQSKLSFSQPATQRNQAGGRGKKVQEPVSLVLTNLMVTLTLFRATMRYPTMMMHLSLLRQRRELLGVGGNSGRSNMAIIAELVVFNFVRQQQVY